MIAVTVDFMEQWTQTAKVIVGLLFVMWAVEILDSFIFSDWFQTNGIRPRRLRGIVGILFHPFLHADFGHIASNTVPFAVLGGFVALRGTETWLAVTLTATILGGSLTWLFAGGNNHIGASGIVFAYLGAILGAAMFERKPAAMAIAMVTILFYATMLIGLLPQPRISWEGHLFGFVSGIAVAWVMKKPPEPRDYGPIDETLDYGA